MNVLVLLSRPAFSRQNGADIRVANRQAMRHAAHALVMGNYRWEVVGRRWRELFPACTPTSIMVHGR